MNAMPPENQDVSSKSSRLPAARISESDLRPIQQAAEAADLNMSVVIREALVRYGQQVIVELVRDREFQASGAYNSPGRRRLRRAPRAKTVSLTEMVSWKFEITTDLAKRWIALGRITVDGQVSGDPTLQVAADEPDRVEKASS